VRGSSEFGGVIAQGYLGPQLPAEELNFIVEFAELLIQHALVGGCVRMLDFAAGFADAQLQALDLSGHFPLGICYFKQHQLHILAPHP
jgi:hypothetical protein